MDVQNSKIESFWKWFKDNSQLLLPEKITDVLVDILDEKVLDLADLNWEIREGLYEKNMLVISAGQNIDLLQTAKRIISLAPKTKDWEFSYYKPAKKWDFILSLKEVNGFDDTINVKSWEYVLLKFQDNTFDIIIKAQNLMNLNNDDKNTIIDIVLESILGDELSYTFIKNVEVVDEFKDEFKRQKSSILNLKEHFYQTL